MVSWGTSGVGWTGKSSTEIGGGDSWGAVSGVVSMCKNDSGWWGLFGKVREDNS